MASGSYGTLPLSDGSVVGLPGDWLRYASLDFGKGSQALTLQLAGFATSGSKVQLRIDSATGPLITTLQPIPSKRGKTARAQIAHVKKVTGVHDVYVLIVGRRGQVEIQSFQFLAASHKR
jgi:arabinoxylan arabinofuranohydrolase